MGILGGVTGQAPKEPSKGAGSGLQGASFAKRVLGAFGTILNPAGENWQNNYFNGPTHTSVAPEGEASSAAFGRGVGSLILKLAGGVAGAAAGAASSAGSAAGTTAGTSAASSAGTIGAAAAGAAPEAASLMGATQGSVLAAPGALGATGVSVPASIAPTMGSTLMSGLSGAGGALGRAGLRAGQGYLDGGLRGAINNVLAPKDAPALFEIGGQGYNMNDLLGALDSSQRPLGPYTDPRQRRPRRSLLEVR